MAKLTILFIVVSSFAVITNANIFNGSCEPIVNEDICVDQSYFEYLTEPKSFQVIGHMEFDKRQGVTMFYSYLKTNLIATISSYNGIHFSINCFKIPYKIKYQKFMDFQLKIPKCNDVYSLFMQMRNLNFNFNRHVNKEPIVISTFKIDKYLSFWGCRPMDGKSVVDRAAWILMDNGNNIEYDSEKLKVYLDDFLDKLRTKINETRIKISSNSFTVYNISDKYTSCHSSFDEKAVYSEIKKDFPSKQIKQSNLKIDESMKLKFGYMILMFLGHFIFMLVFFAIGYQVVIRCYKE
ncbi:unnamed protein product [Chironomus riparius]|uniref:Uncharacterized protein n=1 Tax=Chironomus riparius TaxID=315576 RepID=A0A9N9S1N8_9DIPT|nr:unnamed protein product [Chironomus riparius]